MTCAQEPTRPAAGALLDDDRRAPAPTAPVGRTTRGGGAAARSRLLRRPTRNFWYLAPTAVFLGMLSAYPLVELFRMSLSTIETYTIVEGGWPFAGLQNFRDTLSAPDFWPILRNTLVLVVISVIVTVAGGLVAAAIVERDTRGNRLTQGLLVFLWSTPPLVVGFIWKFLLSSDGFIPNLLAKVGIGTPAEPVTLLADPGLALMTIALISSWVGAAFASLLFRAALLGVDVNLVEAAALDGAGTVRIFRHITLPALRPALLVQALLTVIYGFRIFDLAYITTGGGPAIASTTLPFWAYKESFIALDFARGSAIAVVCVGFVLVFAVLYIRATREETR